MRDRTKNRPIAYCQSNKQINNSGDFLRRKICDAISMTGLLGIVNTLLQQMIMIKIHSFVFYYNSSVQCQMYCYFYVI